jgi:hypothetical protein
MARRFPRVLIIFALTVVTLAACRRDAKVSVFGAGSTPEFVVEPGDGQRCISRLLVYAADSSNRIAPAQWGLGLIFGRGDADCRSRVRYGQTPSGYESDITPKPLIAGKRYRVEVFGAAWRATADWTPQ